MPRRGSGASTARNSPSLFHSLHGLIGWNTRRQYGRPSDDTTAGRARNRLAFRARFTDNAGMSDESFDVVASFLTRIDADLAKTALEAAGIEATVSADDAAGMRPHLWMGGVRLLVSSSDLERAKAVLGEAEGPAVDS